MSPSPHQMNPTQAFVSLRDRGCDIQPSKTSEYIHIVALPNGQVFEVWSRDLVDFAQTVTIK